MMDDITLPSGAKLKITVAPFGDAHALLKAILKAVKGLNLSPESLGVDMSLEGLRTAPPSFLSQIIEKVLSIATSDEVEQALFKCCERSVYQGVRVTREIFDDPKIGTQAREDYYQIAFKVIEANCKPFFKGAFSGFSVSALAPGQDPK